MQEFRETASFLVGEITTGVNSQGSYHHISWHDITVPVAPDMMFSTTTPHRLTHEAMKFAVSPKTAFEWDPKWYHLDRAGNLVAGVYGKSFPGLLAGMVAERMKALQHMNDVAFLHTTYFVKDRVPALYTWGIHKMNTADPISNGLRYLAIEHVVRSISSFALRTWALPHNPNTEKFV